MSALKPDVDSTHDLGTTALRWRKLWVDEIATTEAIAIGGNLTITGNLQVDGQTTTINSTTLTVDDKNIVVAQGAAAAANWTGSGLTVDGANATLLYTDDGAGTTQWEFNNDLELSGKLLPVANATHDLGSSSMGWNDLYLGDDGVLQLGDDQDVTITHIPDAGVRLNAAMKLEFRDATEFLHSDANGSMTLEGGSTVKLSVNSNTVLSVGANTVDIAQPLNVDDPTDSTSITTGSLIVDGGMGLAGDAHFGGDLSLQHDAAELHFGADDDVKLTHVADAGLLLNDGMALRFRDAALEVKSSADGQLDILADSEVAIVAPVVDIDASNAVRISNDLELDSDEAVLKFGGDGDVSLTHVHDAGLLLNAAMQLQFRDSGLKIHSTANGQLDIDSDGELEISAVSNVDIDAADVQIDATATFSIQGADDSDISVAAEAKDLSLVVSGGGAQVLSLASAGTGTDAIDISASAGGVDIDANGVLALDGEGGIDIGKTADVAIDVDSSTLDIDASGAITIDGTSTISIGGAAAAGNITIGTNATARNITVGNVTGATALKLDAGSGGILIGDAADAPVDVDATTFSLDASSTLSLDGGDATNLTMTANAVGNKALTVSAVNSGDGEGHLILTSDSQVSASDGTATLLLDGGVASVSGASTLTLDASGVLELNSSGGVISLGNDNVNQNINVGTAGARTLTVGSDNATKVDLNAATIEADATTKILLDSAGTGADAVDINSAGGVDVDAADVISLTTTSNDGHIELVSAHTAGVALHIDANANAGSILDIDAGILDLDTDGAANIDAAAALSLQGGAASDFTTSSGALTLDGAGGVSIAGNAAEVDITTTGALDLNAGATTLDSSTLSIDSTDTTNLTMTADDNGEKVLTIDAVNSGAGAAKIVIGATAATAVQIGHGTSEVTIGDNLTVAGNLTVSGTQTIVDTVTMQASNAIVFEGATADDFESTLTIIDPTADRTIKLPNQSGCLPVLAADSNVQITATPAELNYVDVTAGTATASKALVLDASKNIATIGTVGCGAITSTGNSGFVQITTSGRVIVDDPTEATSTTDGSLQTDGGLSVAKSAVIGDDLDLISDGAILSFGVNSDVSLTHIHDTGLLLNGASEIQFRDAQIKVKSDADGHLHLEADTGVNLAVNGTDELALTSSTATFGTNIVVPDDATIGSASDTDSITINASGDIAISSTTSSTSSTTGALKVAGGLGVADDLHVGGDIAVTGGLFTSNTIIRNATLSVQDGTESNTFSVTQAGAVSCDSSMGVGTNLQVDGNASIDGNATVDGNTIMKGKLFTQKVSAGAAGTLGDHYIYLVSSDNQTITLPSAATVGSRYIIKQTAAFTNGTIIDADGSQTIDGSETVTLGSRYAFIEIVSHGTAWHIIGQGGTVTLN